MCIFCRQFANVYLLQTVCECVSSVDSLRVCICCRQFASVFLCSQFSSVCRKIERRGLTVGELLKLVVDYCHRREDSYHDRERTLFDDICRVNNC